MGKYKVVEDNRMVKTSTPLEFYGKGEEIELDDAAAIQAFEAGAIEPTKELEKKAAEAAAPPEEPTVEEEEEEAAPEAVEATPTPASDTEKKGK